MYRILLFIAFGLIIFATKQPALGASATASASADSLGVSAFAEASSNSTSATSSASWSSGEAQSQSTSESVIEDETVQIIEPVEVITVIEESQNPEMDKISANTTPDEVTDSTKTAIQTDALIDNLQARISQIEGDIKENETALKSQTKTSNSTNKLLLILSALEVIIIITLIIVIYRNRHRNYPQHLV